MDLSNKSLALLLLAAIVISLGGTMISLDKIGSLQAAPATGVTGFVPGWTAVNITTSTGCTIDQNVDFGDGAAADLTLTTHVDNTPFNDCTSGSTCSGLVINNSGNVNVLVNFTSNQNATNFLGAGDVLATDFRFNLTNGTQPSITQGGCYNAATADGWGGWVSINESTDATVLCDNLTFADATDIISMEFLVRIQTDTPPGLKNATITVNCPQN